MTPSLINNIRERINEIIGGGWDCIDAIDVDPTYINLEFANDYELELDDLIKIQDEFGKITIGTVGFVDEFGPLNKLELNIERHTNE